MIQNKLVFPYQLTIEFEFFWFDYHRVLSPISSFAI